MLIWKKLKGAVVLFLPRFAKAMEHALEELKEEDAKEIQALCSMFDECKNGLERMGNVFSDNKSWEESIVDNFCDLEKELDNGILKGPTRISQVKQSLANMTHGIKELEKLVPRVDKVKRSLGNMTRVIKELQNLVPSVDNGDEVKRLLGNMTHGIKELEMLVPSVDKADKVKRSLSNMTHVIKKLQNLVPSVDNGDEVKHMTHGIKELEMLVPSVDKADKVKRSLGNMTHVIKELRNLVPSVDNGDEVKRLLGNMTDGIKELHKFVHSVDEVKRLLGNMTHGIKELQNFVPSVDNGDEVKQLLGNMTHGIKELEMLVPSVDTAVKLPIEPGDAPNQLLEWDAMPDFPNLAEKCYLCLTVFPENTTIEKRPLIHWWMGEGLVTDEKDATQKFQELLDKRLIRPSSDNKSLSVNSFVIHPGFRKRLIEENSFKDSKRAFLCQEDGMPETEHKDGMPKTEPKDGMPKTEPKDVLTVFNVDKQYLNIKPEWLSNLTTVKVLQMGRWQTRATHHIEVEDQELFNRLGSQKQLKYLSLRGISRIQTLPASISKLISLEILDLRACHNLEKLPSSVSKLKNLTHLDVSQCYLLESMPKGLDDLEALQVLKGFVIGMAENACRISDLKGLKKLRKLSIRVGSGREGQLKSLGDLPALSILTISWRAISVSNGGPVSLPANLTKLDLRCVPFEQVPQWLKKPVTGSSPSKLVKLYIIGGKLKRLDPKIIEDWNVVFLRLKYLDDLNMNEGEWADYAYLDKNKL